MGVLISYYLREQYTKRIYPKKIGCSGGWLFDEYGNMSNITNAALKLIPRILPFVSIFSFSTLKLLIAI